MFDIGDRVSLPGVGRGTIEQLGADEPLYHWEELEDWQFLRLIRWDAPISTGPTAWVSISQLKFAS
jgi:hypothetical protein